MQTEGYRKTDTWGAGAWAAFCTKQFSHGLKFGAKERGRRQEAALSPWTDGGPYSRNRGREHIRGATVGPVQGCPADGISPPKKALGQ